MIIVTLCILSVELAGIAAQIGVTTCTFATQTNCPNFLPNSYCNLATGKCDCATSAGYIDDGSGVACTYQCGDLDEPENGEVDTSGGITTGDVATFSCDNGYKIDGTSTSTCVQDAGWDNTDVTCVPGILGDDCSANIFLCLNIAFGTCDFTSCICQAGYESDGTDNACSEIDECAPSPCQNGATCTDALGSYSCTCVPGYGGSDCETNIDECGTNPCLNGATCVDGMNDYKCYCAAGYDGGDCQNNIDDCQTDLCLNGASCVDGINNYTCNCVAGFNGGNCENNINECASNPCQNGATCVDGINDYTCNCVAGYGGSNCEISHTWIIVGGIIACFAIVLILNNVVCFIWIRRRTTDNKKNPATHVNPIYTNDNAELDGYDELQIPKH